MPYQSWKRQDYYEHNYHDYNRAQMNQYPAYQQKYDKDGARDTKTYDNRDHLRNSYDKPYDNYEQYDKGHHKHEGHYDKPRDSHYDKDKKK